MRWQSEREKLSHRYEEKKKLFILYGCSVFCLLLVVAALHSHFAEPNMYKLLRLLTHNTLPYIVSHFEIMRRNEKHLSEFALIVCLYVGCLMHVLALSLLLSYHLCVFVVRANYILICPTNLTNNVHFTWRKYFRRTAVFPSNFFSGQKSECEHENTNQLEMTPQQFNSPNAKCD